MARAGAARAGPAETSLAYDRETKAPLYAASGVAEYWIIDVSARAVEVRTSPQSGGYGSVMRLAESDTLRPLAFADVTLRVSALFD